MRRPLPAQFSKTIDDSFPPHYMPLEQCMAARCH
jgi:hypothetical protein